LRHDARADLGSTLNEEGYSRLANEVTMGMNNRAGATDGDVDLVEYLRVVWRYKLSIAVSALLAASVLVAVSLALPNIYRAEVLMAPATEESGGLSASGALSALGALGGLIGDSGILPGSTGLTEEYLAVLRSRTFIWEFVAEQQLLPALFSEEWDAAEGGWRDPAAAPSRWDVYELIIEDGMLSVVADEESGLYRLAVEWWDPELAALWANTFIERLNAYLRNREKSRTEQNLAYLNDELGRTHLAEVRQSLFGLITQELNNAMLVNTQTEYAFRVVDPAVPPEEHVWPKRVLWGIAAALLGGVAGVFSAFFREGARRQGPGRDTA
jgi:LPS O-antigen subunit length determinant protein (WzzB/FepE family)